MNNYFDTNLLSKVDGNYFEVKTDYMHQVNTILLRIMITFDGGSFEIVTASDGMSIFKLLVKCGPDSTNAVLPTVFSSADQTYLIDNINSPFYYFPNSFTSYIPACAITSITLIEKDSFNLNSYFDMNLQSNSTGSYF